MRDVSSRDVVLTVMVVTVALIGSVYLISLT